MNKKSIIFFTIIFNFQITEVFFFSVCDLAAVDSDFTSDGDTTQYYSAQSSLDSQIEF